MGNQKATKEGENLPIIGLDFWDFAQQGVPSKPLCNVNPSAMHSGMVLRAVGICFRVGVGHRAGEYGRSRTPRWCL